MLEITVNLTLEEFTTIYTALLLEIQRIGEDNATSGLLERARYKLEKSI